MDQDSDGLSTYVDESAATLGMRIPTEHRLAVISAMKRIAAFAADVLTYPLPDDVAVPPASAP